MTVKPVTNCVFIGAGRLAVQTAQALLAVGVEIRQVYSRTELSAKELSEKCGCVYTNSLNAILPDADLYLYAVKDDALPEVIRNVKTTHGIHAHTAGSVSMQVFEGWQENYGVFYPLQTFSKERMVDFRNIPLFVEANSAESQEKLQVLAEKLSFNVSVCSSEGRQALHLAAVFCCNFSNHLFDIASRILEKNGLPFSAMLPLIEETVGKLQTLTPAEAQTGPALRYDTGVIAKHLEALQKMPAEQQIYEEISRNIHNYFSE